MPNKTEFIERLASLVGDLEVGPDVSSNELVAVRRLAAQALLGGQSEVPELGLPDPSVDLTSLLPLFEEPALEPDPEGVLVSRRMLPIFSTQMADSLPLWAAGRAIERTFGPFRDRLGRDVWIDLFRVVRQVRLVRSSGGEPLVMLPLSLSLVFRPGPVPLRYNLPAGSVWISSRLLAPAAPASSFTGLQISGGHLHFSQPIGITGEEAVVPAAVECRLELDLVAETAPAGSGDGGDARAAQAETPRRVTIIITAAGATISTAEPARVQAYGTAANLDYRLGPPEYLPELNRIAVPFVSDTATFAVKAVESRLFQPEGRAGIQSSAWGLPVAVANPSTLGEASGSGNLILWLEKGLRAAWLGQPKPVALGPTVLMVDAARLAVIALSAGAQGAQQRFDLWEGSAPNTALLRWGQTFPLRFFSQVAGSEVLWTTTSFEAGLDLPLDVKGERLPLVSKSAQAIFVASSTGVLILVAAALEQPVGARRVGLGLANAVFVATPPNQCWLLARLNDGEAVAGTCALDFSRHALLPSLPDPYAVNLRSLARTLDQPGGTLRSIVTWGPVGARLDFILPPGAGNNLPAENRSTATLAGAVDAPLASSRAANDGVLPGAIKALGDATDFERRRRLILLDVSTRSDQFGVAFQIDRERGPSLSVREMQLHTRSQDVLLLTLPAVQWEALITESDPNDPSFPLRLGFANSGVPTLLTVPSVRLVPVHPKAALDQLVENFALDVPQPAQTRFTLPFGIIARANLAKPNATSTRGAELSYNRPVKGDLEGGHQLTIRAVDTALGPDDSPSLAGFTAQLPIGQPGFRSALGDQVTIVFNSYLGASGFRPLVPVERLDLSGYGESLFSDWRNPYGEAVAVSQARFDVLVGRTSHEVIQVRSFLFPYGIKVVRTITIERKNSAIVARRDSGWQAVSDGVYNFELPGQPPSGIETHPGVVRRVTKVTHIRDTGEILTIDGVQLAAVRFDGDLELDGADGLVPATSQLGYVQLTAGTLISAATYRKLIEAAGPLGGAIDANIRIGGGGQKMRMARVGVGITQGLGGTEFVMTAWGSPAFPGGGEWSVLRLPDPDLAPESVARELGVPLIRAGRASAGPPSLSSPYRFADAVDLTQPSNPESDYGILHNTGTQRAFFTRPKIEATDPSRITSTQVPLLADPYCLSTSLGHFPEAPKAIPFQSANWALRVDGSGNFRLELPTSTFPITVGRRTLKQAGSVRGDVDYIGATVTYEVDTALPVPWRFALEGASKVMNSTALGDIIRLGANVRASADRATVFTEPQLKLGGSLSVVQDLLTILADLGITGIMNVAMTNEWSLKVGMKVPFKDPAGEDLQVPPAPFPTPDIKFADTGVSVELKVWPDADEAEFALGGQPMFAIKSIPGLYAVAIIKFGIKLSTESGTTYSLTLGVGIAYELEAGPFELKGLFAITFFGFIGDTALGFGVGFLIQVSVELVIVEVALRLEGKLAMVVACRGTDHETLYGAAKLVFAVEVSIAFVFSISFEFETTTESVMRGPGGAACPLPDIIP